MGRKKINLEERKTIERMIKDGIGPRQIAKVINVSPSAIYTELRRCPGREYDAQAAQNSL